MINVAKTILKTQKKSTARFGLSVVVDLSDNLSIFKLQQEVKKHILNEKVKWFHWINKESYHITLLRCKSVNDNFDVSLTTINLIQGIFQNFNVFTLKVESVKLDDDGIIRIYFSTIPTSMINNIDIAAIELETGFQYKIIDRPWMTTAYTVLQFVNNVVDMYSDINLMLQDINKNIIVDVNEVSLIKYYDNAFQNKSTVCSITLGERL